MMKRIGCVSTNSDPEWRWLEGRIADSDGYDWQMVDAAHSSAFVRNIRRPNLARLSACFRAGRLIRSGGVDIMVSHLPLNTAWTEFFAGQRKEGAYHHAFTFNFTTLPGEKQTRFMIKNFRYVDRFTVYSTFEKSLYSDTFEIPPEKIDVVHWAVERPELAPIDRVVEGDYICSIGGEGRDYRSLVEVAKMLPSVQFVFVAREKNLVGLDIPSNVKTFLNLSWDKTMNILNHSLFAVVPLKTAQTACGHVTIVAGMHLGKAQVVTFSHGVTDYIREGENALFFRANDPVDLKEKVERLLQDGQLRAELGRNGQNFATEFCCEARMLRYFEGVLKTIGLDPVATDRTLQQPYERTDC